MPASHGVYEDSRNAGSGWRGHPGAVLGVSGTMRQGRGGIAWPFRCRVRPSVLVWTWIPAAAPADAPRMPPDGPVIPAQTGRIL
jgi:hypothetical protein